MHAGIIIALVAGLILFIVIWRSPFGYQIRTVGISPKTGRYAGMNIISIQVLATFIGGGLAGIAGATEILGAQFVLRENFLVSFGYDAVVVAVLGQLDPLGVVITSILFGGLRAGRGIDAKNGGCAIITYLCNSRYCSAFRGKHCHITSISKKYCKDRNKN